MNQPKFDLLITDMNMILSVFGQTICNYERKYSTSNVPLPKIAQSWIAMAPMMTMDEWAMGARALIHHCKLMGGQSGEEAISMLLPLEEKYEHGASIFSGIYYRCGRRKGANYYGRGKELVRREIQEALEFAQCDKGRIDRFKHKLQAMIQVLTQ